MKFDKNSPFNDCNQICWMIFIFQPISKSKTNNGKNVRLLELEKIW